MYVLLIIAVVCLDVLDVLVGLSCSRLKLSACLLICVRSLFDVIAVGLFQPMKAQLTVPRRDPVKTAASTGTRRSVSAAYAVR